MANYEAGGRNEEVVDAVEAPADGLRVNGVVGESSAGLIDHLVNSNGRTEGLEHEPDKYAQCRWFVLV